MSDQNLSRVRLSDTCVFSLFIRSSSDEMGSTLFYRDDPVTGCCADGLTDSKIVQGICRKYYIYFGYIAVLILGDT